MEWVRILLVHGYNCFGRALWVCLHRPPKYVRWKTSVPTSQITRFNNLDDYSFEGFYDWMHSLKS